MAGGMAGAANPNKIKGGRWTVVKFFVLGVAYTIVWMAICSELGYYRNLYGPSVLLQMNIMYFLPSIPLLILSGLLDEHLDARFGVARTILIRLVVGLAGCAAVAIGFPFEHPRLDAVLWTVVALGLAHGISFSASYQLVSRFAGKNTIALGLGCVGSGGVVLAAELALRLGSHPTHEQNAILYFVCAGFVIVGLIASTSLLARHWAAIEASGVPDSADDAGPAQPLLTQVDPDPVAGEPPLTPRLRRRSSLPSGVLLALSPLDHFQSVSEGETVLLLEQQALWPDHSYHSYKGYSSDDRSWHKGGSFRGGSQDGLYHARTMPGTHIQVLAEQGRAEAAAASSAHSAQHTAGERLPPGHDLDTEASRAESISSDLEDGGAHGGPMVLAVMRRIWPTQLALFFSGTCGLLIFPFLTYVPSSGMLGQMLPKTLFFVRLAADLIGRMVPRVPRCAISSQRVLLLAATMSVAAMPLFFLYLKSPPHLQSDWLAIAFIAYLWILNGAVNSNSYILAPRLLSTRQKATAAGILAMTYQVAHVIGLLIGVIIVFWEFDGFEVQ